MVRKIKLWFMKTNIGKLYRVKRSLYNNVFKFRLKIYEIKKIEKNPEALENILKKHLDKFQDKEKEVNETIDKVFPLLEIDNDNFRQDMIYTYFAYGFTPNEYICYEFDQKTVKERKEFISDRDSIIYANKLNDIEDRRVFMDKYCTYQKYKNFYKRDAISIASNEDYPLFTNFVLQHPKFVKKLVSESCGRSVTFIDLSSKKCDRKVWFDQVIKEGKVILEEVVVQSKELSQLNVSSVNTVRCFTLITKKGIIVPWCFMKVGRAGSFVDNGGAGGILIGIDVKTGKTITNGIDEIGRRYENHPDSGMRLVDFQVPQWNEMICICKEMAEMEKRVRWVGWDMAHTDNGWVVIEGNALSEVIGPQATSGKGIKKEFDNYIKNIL